MCRGEAKFRPVFRLSYPKGYKVTECYIFGTECVKNAFQSHKYKNNGRFLKFPGLYDNRYFTILFLIICPGAPIGSDRYALTFLFESFFEEEGMGHVE